MGDILGGIPPLNIGAGALVTLVVLLVLTGRLVARQHLLDLTADRDHWRASADKWQAVATQHGMTLERLLVSAEATEHALTEIQSVLTQRRGQR